MEGNTCSSVPTPVRTPGRSLLRLVNPYHKQRPAHTSPWDGCGPGGELAEGLGERRMKVGMLWYDGSDRRPFDAKVQQAVARYEGKYGHKPNLCYVHPSSLRGAKGWKGSIRVMAAENVLPNHFWLGRGDVESVATD